MASRAPLSDRAATLTALFSPVRRLNASQKAAEFYVTQFPSPAVAHVGKFVAFIAGSFAALLLALALVEDTLLERHLFGRTLVRLQRGSVPPQRLSGDMFQSVHRLRGNVRCC